MVANRGERVQNLRQCVVMPSWHHVEINSQHVVKAVIGKTIDARSQVLTQVVFYSLIKDVKNPRLTLPDYLIPSCMG